MDCLNNLSSSRINETQNQNKVKCCFISYPYLEELCNLVHWTLISFQWEKQKETPQERETAVIHGKVIVKIILQRRVFQRWHGSNGQVTSETNNNNKTVSWRCQSREWKATTCEVLISIIWGYDSRSMANSTGYLLTNHSLYRLCSQNPNFVHQTIIPVFEGRRALQTKSLASNLVLLP